MVALLTVACLVAHPGVMMLTLADKLTNCYNQTGANGLRVVLSNVARKAYCVDDPVVDLDNMMDRCSNFCAPNGIPIPIGTVSSGFSQADMDKICLDEQGGGLKYDPSLLQQCKDWSKGITKIKERAADLIAAIMEFTFEQQYYASEMTSKVQKVQAEMQSDSTKMAIQDASADQKIEVIKKILGENYADLGSNGMLSGRLKRRMATMKEKSDFLDKTIGSELGNLNNFLDSCSELMLGTGPNQEYLLDVCSKSNADCIESVNAEHLGCCCGVVPSAFVFEVTANTFMSRRLSQLQGESFVHTCGLAYEIASSPVADIVNEIASTTAGASTLQTFGDAMKEKYPAYYADCNSRRLELGDANGIDSLDDNSSSIPAARELQAFLTCEPPGQSTEPSPEGGGEDLRVAFTDTTEDAVCYNIPGMTDTKMEEMCNEFCAPFSIPILLGSVSFGFNQQQMDEVCLRPDFTGTTFYPYSSTKVKQCHADGEAFSNIQLKTVNLIAKLEILDAQQALFIAKSKDTSSKVQAAIKQYAPGLVDGASNEPGAKIAALKSILKDALDDFMGNAVATSNLKDAIASVQVTATELSNTLQAGIPKVENFIDGCNGLVTGVGPNLEYLLDLCSQSSKDCIDTEWARHAGCCCGYNPVTSFGEILPQSITGIPTTIKGWPSSRRLASDTMYDICAQGYVESLPEVSRLQSQADSIDASVWASRKASQREKYPSYSNRCEEPLFDISKQRRRRRSTVAAPQPSPLPTPTPGSSPTPTTPVDTTSHVKSSHGFLAFFLGCAALNLLRELP